MYRRLLLTSSIPVLILSLTAVLCQPLQAQPAAKMEIQPMEPENPLYIGEVFTHDSDHHFIDGLHLPFIPVQSPTSGQESEFTSCTVWVELYGAKIDLENEMIVNQTLLWEGILNFTEADFLVDGYTSKIQAELSFQPPIIHDHPLTTLMFMLDSTSSCWPDFELVEEEEESSFLSTDGILLEQGVTTDDLLLLVGTVPPIDNNNNLRLHGRPRP